MTSGGTGGMSGWGRRRSMHHGESGMYASESSGLRGGAAERGMASHDIPASKSNGSYGMPGTIGGGTMGSYGSGGMDVSPSHPTTIPVSTSRDDFSVAAQSVDNVVKQRAKANYAYSASPDDPNEVSFAKGEILEVLDNTGKWFQVRTSAGQQGVSTTERRGAVARGQCRTPSQCVLLPRDHEEVRRRPGRRRSLGHAVATFYLARGWLGDQRRKSHLAARHRRTEMQTPNQPLTRRTDRPIQLPDPAVNYERERASRERGE